LQTRPVCDVSGERLHFENCADSMVALFQVPYYDYALDVILDMNHAIGELFGSVVLRFVA
jgi:hypothetical protein